MSAPKILMRFSSKGLKLYDQVVDHVEACRTCGPLAKTGDRPPPLAIASMGCLAGVMLATEWAAEYVRLHSPAEREAIARFGESLGMEDRPFGGQCG